MPGNGGILPDQNSFSVPVLMPECKVFNHHIAGTRRVQRDGAQKQTRFGSTMMIADASK